MSFLLIDNRSMSDDDDWPAIVATTTIKQPNTTMIFDDPFSFWVSGVLALSLVVVGVVGNVVMVVSLLRQRRNWPPLYYYFLTYSIWNTALLVSTAVFYCLPALNYSFVAGSAWIMLYLVGYPLGNTGMTAAIWLVLGLTVERCLAVSRPLSSMLSKPTHRARCVTLGISILAPLYNAPLYMEFRINDDYTDLVNSALRNNTVYKMVYRVIGNVVFLSFVPFMAIMIMSLMIICVVQQTVLSAPAGSTRKGSSKSSSAKDKRRTLYEECASEATQRHTRKRQRDAFAVHVTLTVLATKFVLCYTLPTVLNILEIICEPLTITQCGIGALIDVSNFMVLVDSVIHTFVYMSWRRKIQTTRLKTWSKHSTVTIGNGEAASSKRRLVSDANSYARHLTKLARNIRGEVDCHGL